MSEVNDFQTESLALAKNRPISRHYITVRDARARDIHAIRMAREMIPGNDRLADVVDLALVEFGRQCREILARRPELGLGSREAVDGR